MTDPSRPLSADDLFDKLDSLLIRYQSTLAGRTPPPSSVPVLTEAVEAARRAEREVPVLDQPIELSSESAAMADKRRQLQVALYLRLRQRLDAELSAAFTSHPAIAAGAQPELERAIEALRTALPQIVRESVAQVLGPETPRQGR